jgi:hypothetical protein
MLPAVLGLSFFLTAMPAWATPSCSPTAEGQSGSGSRTGAHGTQHCTGGDTGIAYKANGGNLVVDLDNDPVTGHAININDDGNARNITVNDGLPTSGYVASPILANDSNSFAVNLQSSGGNVQFTTYTGGTVTYSGTSTMGAAIGALTTGSGTVTITTDDAVSDLAGSGIGAQTAAGAINIVANGNVTSGSDSIYAASQSGDITVVTGSASNPVSITTNNNNVHDAVNAESNGGNVSVTTYGSSTGELLAETTGIGNISLTTNGAVTATGGNAAVYASLGSGDLTIMTNGNLIDDMAAVASGAGNITISTNGSITESDSYNSIYTSSNGGNIEIAVNGDLSNGVNATTTGSGVVTVTVNGNIPSTQPYDAIYAASGNGNVEVAFNGTSISTATGGYGIEADANGLGNSIITLGNGVTIDPPTVGVYAYSTGGIATVTAGDNENITAVDIANAAGIIAKSDLAPATATDTALVTTGANDVFAITGDESSGISAINRGDGLGGVNIATGSGNRITVTGDDSAAILGTTLDDNFATGHFDGAGNVTIHVGASNVLTVNPGAGNGLANGGVVAATDGGNIDVEWAGAGGSISVDGASGVATAGIAALEGAGAGVTPTPAGNPQTLTVITGSGTAIASSNGVGIFAANLNFGQTTVTSNGPITASVASGSTALSAILSVVPNPFTASSEGGGIIALGDGATAVTSNGAIAVTGGDGIDGFSATSLVVANNAAITADQSAITAASLGDATITNEAAITGAGTASHPVVAFAAASTSTLVNGASGMIQSNAGSPSDLVIAATTPGAVAVVLVNNGAITGRIDLSGASSASFTNSQSWTTSGTSNFSAGVLNNSGTVTTSGTTTFNNLAFNNSGTLEMHGDDPATGDLTIISGTFTGSAGSKLVVDSSLGTIGSGATCGTLSDCLQVGGSSGTTGIVVHNTASPASAGYNSAGILVVSGASAAGNFTLDPSSDGYNSKTGTIEDGLFSYGLDYNSADQQVRLVSSPNAAAFQMPVLETAAQNVWYETSPWLERQADLRDQLGPDGTGNITPGVWAKGVANFLDRDSSVSFTASGPAASFGMNTRYIQDSYGAVLGGDVGARALWSPGDALMAGIMVGYLDSTVDFRQTPSKAQLSGVLLGAYMTYLNQGWVVDAAFKANLLTTKYAETGASPLEIKPDASSLGGQVETGKRFTLDEDVFLEPLASFSYVVTSFDDASIGGVVVHFSQDQSARGSIGLRIGKLVAGTDGNMFDLSLTGRIWDEFDGDAGATIPSGGTSLAFDDKFSGTIGEFAANADVLNMGDGWSGFLNGGIKFKNNFTSETVTAGVRYHW